MRSALTLRFLLIFPVLAVLSACEAMEPQLTPQQIGINQELQANRYIRSMPIPDAAQAGKRPSDDAAAAFARSFLNSINPASIRDKVEYCGYFYINTSGQIAATEPRRGTFASCTIPGPNPNHAVFASYHTHSAFARGYDNEVPSITDLQSDFQLRIDGYLSTPGGRVWHVDYGSRTARQVCGLRCVAVDPGFVPVNESAVRARYSLDQLAQRARGGV